MDFIDLKTQQVRIRDKIDSRIRNVLEHGQYILGPEVYELEEALAKYVGVEHCVTVASGTDALQVALMALGIGPGDEVITVPYTWISTAEVVALLGAKPVFVDIDERTFNLNPELLEAAITERTKAIIPVGIYGQCADMDKINEIAKGHDIVVIEDGAQSFGATYKGKKSCSLSDLGCTSFFPSKPLGCYGDGGAIFTNNPEWAEICKSIRVHGQTKKHHHPRLGITGRMDTIQAAILLEKLAIFEEECTLRKEAGEYYSSEIKKRDFSFEVQFPYVAQENQSVYAQYTILVEDPCGVSKSLSNRDIPSVSYYAVPLHVQPVFSGLGYQQGDFPITERIASQGLSLPFSPYIKSEDQRLVLDVLCSL